MECFSQIATDQLKINFSSSKVSVRRFKSFFRASYETCNKIWSMIQCLPESVKNYHLLYALHFLKCYKTEANNAHFFNVDEKTFRKYNWLVLEGLKNLDMVC